MAPSASLAGAIVGILTIAAFASRWVIDAVFNLAGG
ncbi:MAG: hypothetical protein JWO72_2663 [Caulobacteraceae bacterium]|jgi:hypothetical protein|nr:hypothetical protein [Caulobacteraceae bacterium]